MIDPGLVGAGDQLEAVARTYATEFARFYRTLIERDVPASLAKTMTLAHQAYRYGWTTDE